jgi:hypothetical protein
MVLNISDFNNYNYSLGILSEIKKNKDIMECISEDDVGQLIDKIIDVMFKCQTVMAELLLD